MLEKFVPMPLPTFVLRPKKVASTKPNGENFVFPMLIDSGEGGAVSGCCSAIFGCTASTAGAIFTPSVVLAVVLTRFADPVADEFWTAFSNNARCSSTDCCSLLISSSCLAIRSRNSFRSAGFTVADTLGSDEPGTAVPAVLGSGELDAPTLGGSAAHSCRAN